MAALAWGARVSAEFRRLVRAIAAEVGIDPSHLMADMAFESGQTFSPGIKNKAGSGATGLIQFMPRTAIGLGTTVDDLAAMTAEDQLHYVLMYFRQYSGRMHNFADTYMAILLPNAIGLPDDAVLFPPGSKALLQNRGLDVDHDGEVTKGEAASFPLKQLALGMQEGNVWTDEDAQPAAPIEDHSIDYQPQPENNMGGLALTFLQPLLGAVLEKFSGRAQATISQATGASPDAAQALLTNLLGAIGAKVGIPVTNQTSAIQAVAAITKDPADEAEKAALQAKIAELEKHSLDYLDHLSPLLDKLMAADAAASEQGIAEKDAASLRSTKERWDMTPWLVFFAGGTSTALVVGLAGAIIFQSIMVPKGIDVALIGIAGPLLAIAMGVWREVFSYRFDGSRNSSAQTALAQTVMDASKKATA